MLGIGNAIIRCDIRKRISSSERCSAKPALIRIDMTFFPPSGGPEPGQISHIEDGAGKNVGSRKYRSDTGGCIDLGDDRHDVSPEKQITLGGLL